jgi:hypothetical protein
MNKNHLKFLYNGLLLLLHSRLIFKRYFDSIGNSYIYSYRWFENININIEKNKFIENIKTMLNSIYYVTKVMKKYLFIL